jgi:hypothetical protein
VSSPELESAALAVISDQPATVDPSAKMALRDEEDDLDRAKKRAELDGLRQDIGARKKYAKGAFILICGWLVFVFYVILAQGFKTGVPGRMNWLFGAPAFELSEPIMIALITTTTGSVIGIFFIVMQYLFPKR